MILETTETQSSEQPAAVASLLSGNGSMCGNHPAAAAAAAPVWRRCGVDAAAWQQLRGSKEKGVGGRCCSRERRTRVFQLTAVMAAFAQWKAMASAEQKMLSGRAAGSVRR